ncbi:hypothetical protein NDI49_17480 [Trichocoleus sp. ST-U3]
MDVKSIASRVSADGLSPAQYVKEVLNENLMILPKNKGETTTLFRAEMSRALLHESILYLLRSMSQIVSYEAAYTKHQFSWAAVTLYYANYFSVLSMNRLAGVAISTANGTSYEVKADTIQSNFFIERIAVNNHKLIWDTNYDLYSSFNWYDNSYDGTIINVPLKDRKHTERKEREYLNYHPDSYKELFKSHKKQQNTRSFFGKYYSISPEALTLTSSSFSDSFELTIANLESGAMARQTIVLEILKEVIHLLQPISKSIVVEYFQDFTRNIMSKSPFNSKLKNIFNNRIKSLLFI